MSQENVEIVYRIAAALGPRDVSTFLEVTDPDVEWHSSLSVIAEGGAYHGHDGVRQYVKDVEDTFDLLEATLDQVLWEGNVVLGVGQLAYRGKTSGVEQTERFGWVFRFRGGRVNYLRAFRDPERVLANVGLRE